MYTVMYYFYNHNSTVALSCIPGETPISEFSKETPKSYHYDTGCGSGQFYSRKVTSEIFIHINNTLRNIENNHQRTANSSINEWILTCHILKTV